jgi:DMSO/TMAO reductase YedYZ molybdopterin-dependent catalytic subunit
MQRIQFSRAGYLPGLAAGLVASVVMLLLGKIWGAPVPAQLLSDRLNSLIPLSVFSDILGQLEGSAKPLLFALIFIGQIVVGGVVGGLLAGYLKRGTAPLNLFVITSVVMFVLLGFVLAPLGRAGVLGQHSSAGMTTTTLSFAIIALIFAGSMVAWLTAAGASMSRAHDESRRRVVAFVGVGVPVLLASAYLGKFFVALSKKSQVPSSPNTADGISPALTPLDDFYVVSKNFVDPTVNASDWNLTIDGLVNNPKTYTYDQIKARPSTKHTATLECISNEVGGEYISTGEWTGFPFHELLDEAGVKPGVVDVELHAADGYSESFPIAKGMDPNTFLVYEIDGEPLPTEHGFPVRLLVPNIYGMKNVKWLTKITLINSDYKGYWQHQGWSDIATEQTMSRIDFPTQSTHLPVGKAVKVGGVAFAGSRGIKKVELSTDGGKSWNVATLQPALSQFTWVIWTYMWTPAVADNYTLVVRATDGTGQTQTSEDNPPAPDGATGYDSVQVRAATATT